MPSRRSTDPDEDLPRNIDRHRSYFDILERLVEGVSADTTASEPAGADAIAATLTSTPTQDAPPPDEPD
jgi:hypothetical protein